MVGELDSKTSIGLFAIQLDNMSKMLLVIFERTWEKIRYIQIL